MVQDRPPLPRVPPMGPFEITPPGGHDASPGFMTLVVTEVWPRKTLRSLKATIAGRVDFTKALRLMPYRKTSMVKVVFAGDKVRVIEYPGSVATVMPALEIRTGSTVEVMYPHRHIVEALSA
jgi:hypothetical protein